MSSIESLRLKCLCGTPIFLKDICAIYPITLREIAQIGEEKFWEYVQILLTEKPYLKSDDKLAEIIKPLNNFQYFLLLTSLDKDFLLKVKEAFMIFTKENVLFSLDTEEIIIGPIEEKHLLKEEDFYEFQKIIKMICFLEKDSIDIVINDNDSSLVKSIKQKQIENKKKMNKAKRISSDKSNLQISDLIASLAIGQAGLNILNIWDITYYAFHDQLKRINWREQFDINNRAAMAGAKIKKTQLKHWIKSIDESEK